MDLQDFTPSTDDIVVTLKVGDKTLTNNDDTPMTITFYSPHSKESKSVKYQMIDSRIEKVRESETDHLSAEELEDINLEAMVKNTKTWDITWNKKKPKLSEKIAKEIYEKAPWIKNLYDSEVRKHEVFMMA